MRTREHLGDPEKKGPRRGPIGGPIRPRPPQDVATLRVSTGQYTTDLWGWPSRGGVICLDRAIALDFEFLGLDSVNPPMRRDRDQDAEDLFCQRLLLLGAKWFDNEERCCFVAEVAENEEPALNAIITGDEPKPSTMERRWVSVAFPDGQSPEGGFWVLEFESGMRGTPSFFVEKSKKPVLMPGNAGRVHLAKTMTEKCAILEKMGAKFYTSLAEYDGPSCLNAWTQKKHGEFGPLEWIDPVWMGASNFVRSGTFEFTADGVKLKETSSAEASSPKESLDS